MTSGMKVPHIEIDYGVKRDTEKQISEERVSSLRVFIML